MNYNNGVIDPISILCTVKENYYEGANYTVNAGKAMTLSGWIAAIVAATSVATKIAKDMVSSLMLGGIIGIAVNQVMTAKMTYKVTANVYDQTIYGKCTSHSGKPTGSLYGQIVYANTGSGLKIYKFGYNTTTWGTGELGRQMFWKVWGTEYTPTSWTGL